MKRYWERVRTAIDDMSLRERAMIFVAVAFVVISLMNVILLDPLLSRQKMLSTQVVQQQEKMIELKTLPVSLLIEKPQAADIAAQPTAANSPDGQKQPGSQKQIFKHGVRITVRGGYLDLMRYVTALEKMPAQMFWGEASLSVEKYPDAVFTLTVYTLSLDKTWLAV